MSRRSPLFWFRWGTVALSVSLCIGGIVENANNHNGLHAILLFLIYVVYAAIFLRNTRFFPRRVPAQIWMLLAQIAISTPLESNLSVVTAATIPLVTGRRHWKRWLLGTLTLVALQTLIRNGIRLYTNFTQLPPGVTTPAIAITALSGILEILAWHVFAYLAAVMIVRFDEDRRRLALLNAEMKGAQILLLESGRLGERLRISRELHDSLGHHLTSLSLQLQVAEHLPDDQLRRKLAEARLLARLLLAEIREAVSEWRSETSPALPQALESLSDGMPGLTVKLDIARELPATAPSLTHALFRCTQEALTNAIRHGSASTVQLSLNHSDQNLTLRIEDDGAGCASVAPGNGLRGMTSRMAELGGSVSFDSAPNRGFHIQIQVPMPEVELQ